MKIHEKYIKRCIQLAKNGLANAKPNPSVGAVIVYNNTIIGESYTSKFGGNHAEINAIANVKDKTLLSKATIYVSLEPCSHFGKTPPCSDLIIKYNIPNVVIGAVDSNSKVAGNGIRKLQAAGINVITGILENECREANKKFFTFHEKKRPYIILKWAESQDGFIAPLQANEKNANSNRKPIWISNSISRQLVHKWRSEEHAILVGTQTVIADNPKLDVRDWTGQNPIRIVLDQNNRIPKESSIFDNSIKTIVINKEITKFDADLADNIVKYLFDNAIQSVIIEGGKQTLQTFIDANLWDEARVFKGCVFFTDGTKAPVLNQLQWSEKQVIGNDELLIFKNHD